MKTIFIETKRKFKDSDINLKLLDTLKGKTIALAATIQYIDLIPKVKEYLESKGKKVIVKQGAYYKGHVLGCNSSALDKSADTLLLITDGTFHAINNAIQLQKEIYVFSGNTLDKIEQKEIDTHNKKTLTKQKKFLTAKTIGLLVSTKHGQSPTNLKELKPQEPGVLGTKHGQHLGRGSRAPQGYQKAIHNIRQQIEKQNKKVYIFESNNIDTNEFENFPKIQMWVNTACFGLARDDMRIINLTDILQFLK